MRWLLLSIILGIFNSAFAQKSEKQVLADSLHNQAVELSIQEKKDTALVLMERVLKLRLEAGIDYLFVKSISDKIEMQRGLPDLEGALKTIEKADSFVQKAQETAYNADYYTRKAAVLYELKDKEGALKAVIESRRVSIAQKDSLNRLRNLTVEGAIYRDMGKLPKATRVLKQLRYYAKRDGRNDHLAMSDYNLAQVYFDLEMIDSEKVFIDEFFEIENNAAGPVINELMMEYNAKIYRLKNDYKKADEAMQELMNMRMKRMDE